MAIVLAVIGVYVYFHLKNGLDTGIARALRDRAGVVATLVHQLGPDRLASRRPPLESGKDEAQVIAYDGRVIAGDEEGEDGPLIDAAELRRAMRAPITLQRGERIRVLAEPLPDERVVVVVAASLRQREGAMESLAGSLAIGGPALLLLAAGGGYLLTGAALRPVELMRRRASTITAAEPDSRLPLPAANDEVRRLGETLNEMVARLDAAFERERSFVAEASHELRTPLAILRMEVELALRHGRTAEELRAALASALDETDRLGRLAENLLELARSDRGEMTLASNPVPADELLDAVATRFAVVAREDGRRISVQPDPSARVLADPDRVEQALGNLVDNALRYGAGQVTLGARIRDGTVELHVEDEGTGFSDEFLPRAFERFARADPARSSGGVGLGLALVNVIARAHGGEARAANTATGADVWLVLPAPSSQLTAHS
jgi:signal transduction histidine kinase